MADKHHTSDKQKKWEEVLKKDEDLADFNEADSHIEALEEREGTQAELSEELKVAQTEAKRNYELFIRAQAELENAKRRAQLDIENAHKYGIRRLVEELVPVLDGIEQGLQTSMENEPDAIKQMYTGMELTYNMLLQTLKKYGIEQLNPEGALFNPDHHEAMSMIEAAGVEKNTVIKVFQKGYLLNGRLLRPARVIVAK